jgi:hypothetical protein
VYVSFILSCDRYPWVSDEMPAHELRGHSNSMSRVAFTSGDGFLLTVGARDRCDDADSIDEEMNIKDSDLVRDVSSVLFGELQVHMHRVS